jgi:hypothetical protein
MLYYGVYCSSYDTTRIVQRLRANVLLTMGIFTWYNLLTACGLVITVAAVMHSGGFLVFV